MKRKKGTSNVSSAVCQSPGRRPHEQTRQPLLLLVDDDTDMRELIRITLETQAHLRVIEASTSKSALANARRFRVDLVISDVARPGMNGLRFLKLFRKEHPLVPVIIASGDPKGSTEAKAQHLGAYAFLRKPFTLDCLLKVVRQALEPRTPKKS